ncbi:porin family protein [Abyssibius alkaniclasticus]|uniref:outer membrane protein n=1 Tax=Abyssibius alkaniclasticus TaxID=2881234 RepID=UPI00236421E8|nr:outer membrane beta-barrel protein [Abyssibius alkaniclasticus]UPH70844.1 porin family protein [Abyssibius alkaniclasticus]
MKVFALLCSGIAIASAASADGVTAVTMPVTPAAAPAPASADWGGFYLGGSYVFGRDSVDDFQNGGFVGGPFIFEGSSIGGFAGYNIQRGNFVLGGEVAYTAGPTTLEVDGDTYSDFFDLKGRIGYAMNRVMVYGVVGWSTATRNETTTATATSGSGFSYGAGVDVLVTDRIFVGVEYLTRQLNGDYDQFYYSGYAFENASRAISLRAGFSF